MACKDFQFGTKAETLAALKGRLRNAALLDQVHFTLECWQHSRAQCLAQIRARLGSGNLIVRSSCLGEDAELASMAGAYASVPNVSGASEADIAAAVQSVAESYGSGTAHLNDQVLVQPMLMDVALSGVAMSRDLDTGAPYFVINYDDFSGRTDTVTSGANSKTLLILRSANRALRSPRIVRVVETLREIETQTNCDTLDIEFCVTSAGDLFVLQVRRMATKSRWRITDTSSVGHEVAGCRAQIEALLRPVEGVAGDSSIFGEMPDWNPAEMIGSAPKPLAYSLYSKLITDCAWSTARARMGYKNLGARPLMHKLSGRPYIDVRMSLNSLLPAGLDDNVESKLINYQLARLAEHRDLHDKIEFEIAISCLDLSFERRQAELLDAGLTSSEIATFRHRLLDLTNKHLRGGTNHLAGLLATNQALVVETADLVNGGIADVHAALDACEQRGIVPFAELARHAFVAVSWLRSLVACGLLSKTDEERFFASIETVTSRFVSDLEDLGAGEITIPRFLAQYGHLRPGTYDITSLRYDEMPGEYLTSASSVHRSHVEFEVGSSQKKAIDEALLTAGVDSSANQLFAYMRTAIQSREESKFLFTKVVSDALVALTNWGESLALSREELAYLTLHDICSGISTAQLHKRVELAQRQYELTQAVKLPHLIDTPDDVEVVRVPLGRPSYITNAVVSAPCQLIADLGSEVSGYIVLIESADPGYDWIFSHPISGLITQFGGANSHMAIRCAEFGIPAAIGCGQRLFELALKSQYVELDCGAGSIRFLRDR